MGGWISKNGSSSRAWDGVEETCFVTSGWPGPVGLDCIIRSWREAAETIFVDGRDTYVYFWGCRKYRLLQ